MSEALFAFIDRDGHREMRKVPTDRRHWRVPRPPARRSFRFGDLGSFSELAMSLEVAVYERVEIGYPEGFQGPLESHWRYPFDATDGDRMMSVFIERDTFGEAEFRQRFEDAL